MTISMPELERRRPVLERALGARERLAQLRNSVSWRQRYFSGDPAAIAEYDRLVGAHAAGTAIAQAVKFGAGDPATGGGARIDADALLEHGARVAALAADPDFVRRYGAGDAAAVRAFNQVSTGGAEALANEIGGEG